jgi:hypothetical protein
MVDMGPITKNRPNEDIGSEITNCIIRPFYTEAFPSKNMLY